MLLPPRRRLALLMMLLVVWAAGLSRLSHAFGETLPASDLPIGALVALLSAGGIVYLAILLQLRRLPSTFRPLTAVLLVGVLVRALLLPSAPILEDDFHRYLWDGAVLAHGLDPYEVSPSRARSGTGDVGDARRLLAVEGGPTLARVNHPELTTIYPPVAVAAFAAAHALRPWEPLGLKLVWLAFDLITLALLAHALRGRPSLPWGLAVYWLNPVLVKEVYNSCHMELVVVTFSTAAVALAARSRRMASGLGLAMSVGAKLWPALWLPLLLRRAASPARALGVAVLVAVVAAALLGPMLSGVAQDGSGLAAYASRWQMNDSAFVALDALARTISPAHAQGIARSALAVVLAVVACLVARTPVVSADDLYERALVVVAALFLTSPTQFPWYYLWLLPMLALRPRWSLLSLTVTLPLYYLRFRLAPLGRADLFDYGVVWIEFAPAWILLLLEWRGRLRIDGPPSPRLEVSPCP